MPTATVAKVADASVLAAYIFGEPRLDEARALLERTALVEPTLLGYELANAARTKCVREPERREAIVTALELGLGLDIDWVEVVHPAVLALALETGLTAHDASYLYIARTLSLPLLTFDTRLLAAAGGRQ